MAAKKNTASNDLMEQLHAGLATQMLDRLKEGDLTAAEWNTIRQFLKDNNIDSAPSGENPLGALINTLPFATTAATIAEDSGESLN